ncbi:MAG: hypothetical protein H7A32_06090 [Deltaproteobacteria bacterium]|nr:hypothetical protein [Deltaproteobacteria bacterium]
MVKPVTGNLFVKSGSQSGNDVAKKTIPQAPAFQRYTPQELLTVLEDRKKNYKKHRQEILDSVAKFEAEEILKVGCQTGEDDYKKRFEAFIQKIEGKDSEYENKLISEVLKQDEGAADSWLSFSNIQQAIQNGEINVDQSKLIGEGFAAAYNQDPKYLDKYISPPQPADFDFNGKMWEADFNKRIQFLDWIKSSSGPESKKFQENFPKNIKKSYLKLIEANPYQKIAATGFILYLNGENIFADSSIDSISNIFSASANSENEEGKELSIGLARVAAENPQLFEVVTQYGGNIDNNTDRVNALGELMTKKSGPILDELTSYSDRIVGTQSGIENSQTYVNVSNLGTLFRLNLLGDSQYSQKLRQKVISYSSHLKNQANMSLSRSRSEGYLQSSDQLAMLYGAASVAISQDYTKLRASKEMQKQVLGLVVDMSLDLSLQKLPIADSVGSRIGSGLKSLISKNLNQDSKIKAAIARVEENEIIDERTNQLQFDVRERIISDFGAQVGDLSEKSFLQNFFKDALLDGISDQRDVAAIRDRGNGILQNFISKN